ncbi:septum site-determining protein MinC [Synechococcus sp. W4D4]|uniref:septum site-determining protein MinC n=1 Tax=Synechococcus sp. W4D4 TaxID=3392294 RepID=UPI0039E9AC5F
MQADSRRFLLRPLRKAEASPLEEIRSQLGAADGMGTAALFCEDRLLTLPELQAIAEQLKEAHWSLVRVESREALSLVPAAALGLETALIRDAQREPTRAGQDPKDLTIHRGTLRSGDHLQVDGSVLVLGDVNPGARVSAGGDVRVWGRLRGIAHAGQAGNTTARIVALQLRPLQLRIANAVARGPEDLPPPGFSEEALLIEGVIAIRPAEPLWPQDG